MTPSSNATALSLPIYDYIMLASALKLDTRQLIADAGLSRLDDSTYTAHLHRARTRVIANGFAFVSETGGRLRVANTMAPLIEAALNPRAGFQLMHARRDVPPIRLRIGVPSQASRTQFVSDLAGGESHELIAWNDARSLSAYLQQVAGVADVPARAPHGAPRNAQARLPGSIFPALADIPPRPDAELRTALTAAGLSTDATDAFLRAGLNPVFQTVFYSLRPLGGGLASEAIVCFGDEHSAWLLDNATIPSVRLRAADARMFAEALNKVLTASTR
jgi:hypothetical protein